MSSRGFVTGEPLQLGDLPRVWQALDQRDEEVGRADTYAMTQMPLTDRAFDERDKTGQRAYIHASAFIGVARDNQKALEEML